MPVGFNMSGSYNLRSIKRKDGISIRNCYLQKYSNNKSPDAFNPKVCLERLKLLEDHNLLSSRFYVGKGKITIKQNESILKNKKYLLKFFCTVILIVVSVMCFKDFLLSHSIAIVKKFEKIQLGFQNSNSYFDANKFDMSILNQVSHKKEKINPKNGNSVSDISGETLKVDNSHIRKLVRDYILEINKKNKIQNLLKPSLSFIEEQCSTNLSNNFSPVKDIYYNDKFIDLFNLTDYALESEGAKIRSVFNTELYGTITVKYLNFNLWPKVAHFLMNYLKCFSSTGPNSVLIPWKKPGDCWAFKGSYGRVQIQLSEEIFVTAISIDHIPRESAPNGSILSAPKKFSVLGIEESKTHISRTDLGTFEYRTAGPAVQTFAIKPIVKVPYRIIEVIIESNHGNKNYTCIYKIRIHGHK